MRRIYSSLLATASVVIASQNVFSVHDDILAFPQFEVVFSDLFISDKEANFIIENAPSAPAPSVNSNTKDLESPDHELPHPTSKAHRFDASRETYELMFLHGEQHLCSIPTVKTQPRNETSEAEARAAEQKELARATDRGWELLQGLEGNCLYFIQGWWSYEFCYNTDITQFHQLPPQSGKKPEPDPATMKYVLGRARGKQSKQDEWGNEVAVQKARAPQPPKTELQVKGDTRYLVQKMEGGTTCDLTGKPRRVEVQYHCNPHSPDRIGYIKEVTTCSYLLVVYTPRLCNDLAFVPPKESKAHPIVCRTVVPAEDLEWRYEMRTLDHELKAAEPKDTRPRVGGLIVGGGKWMNKDGARMPIPANFGKQTKQKKTTIVVKAKPKADGGQVESMSDADLLKMDLDPKVIEELKDEMREVAKDKGWTIEVIADPGDVVSVFGLVDGGDDATKGGKDKSGKGSDSDSEEGSQEEFKDEL